MKGTITKIHPPKASANGDTTYIRVEFELENGKWAKTDICPKYRNYKNWKGLGNVGNVLDGLKLKREGEVDADSKPFLTDGLFVCPKCGGTGCQNCEGIQSHASQI